MTAAHGGRFFLPLVLIAAAVATFAVALGSYRLGEASTPTPARQTVTIAPAASWCRQTLASNEHTAIRALGQALNGHRRTAMNLAAHVAAVPDRCTR